MAGNQVALLDALRDPEAARDSYASEGFVRQKYHD
jgi:hypothetical protein